jgi:phosphatidylglycerol lysyltransferase
VTFTVNPSATTATRERVIVLLQRHGWNATSFQSLEAGFRYWFDGDDACVAYVETRGAWVVAGAPIAAPERLGEVVRRFVAAAREAGKRCAIFAAEARLIDVAELDAMLIGEQPVWDPVQWESTVASSKSLREQLRRARKKGVAIRRIAADELRAPDAPLRLAIAPLIERWLHDKPMAPLGFLVDVQPFDFPDERRYFLAERDGAVVGFLAAVPIYGRGHWLFEDFLRDRVAPNGTAELLVDAGMRTLAAEGSRYATLGLAPLSGAVTGFLRAARGLTGALYDFSGLRAFKAKLKPHAWDSIYLAHPRGTSSHLALIDALSAFARGSLLRYGSETLLRGPAIVVRVLAALLVPWTVLLAFAPAAWFPFRWVKTGWVAFDAALVVALFALTARWRNWLGATVATAIAADAVLTTLQVVVYNLPRVANVLEGLVMAISIAGPAVAALVLWGAVGHHRSAPPPANAG